ncbi:hypothetical protein LEP1GSC191_1360 [Leptospira borgpetersenii serovar Mini str. 201000851]|uniref:Uncharacterized protein n=1 Tax=Leptospira borgpetersenii str. 200801926 TaxID=1193009 RepID=A0ABP2S9N0_LEPBO|nr:hypothetical protein LEP1GSC128_1528 [Leptospira borgpetersenii str. 200801926]ENO64005.1 hypothetical protein LEP1GSC191_1360 [Leptospira borgpetersenii serovar Mini str. 201000851]
MVFEKLLNLFQNFRIVGVITRLTVKRRLKKPETSRKDGICGNYYALL